MNKKEIESPKQTFRFLLWVAFFVLLAVVVWVRFLR